MTERAEHAAETFSRFDVVDGALAVGGVPVPRLAARVGRTPFYVYSRDIVAQRISALRGTLPPSIHLSYAVKANPMPALVQHIAGLVDGFDVASGNELKVALDTPLPPDTISFAGPGKSQAELSQAVAAGILLNAESVNEIHAIAAAGEALGVTPRVALRVNPDFDVKASGMRMGGGAKVFGIDAEQAPDALRTIGGLPVDFEGFHIFSGSQILNTEALVELQCQTVDLAIRLNDDAPAPVRTLNIGGGFGIPYFPGERPLDLAPIADNLAAQAEKVQAAMPDARMVLELGRYLVGEAGVYVCRIVDRKVSRGTTFLVTDGGLHHQLVASGNFGQVLRRNFPVAIANRMGSKAVESVNITGCLCTPNDVLARDVAVPAAEIGDYVAVLQSGAYGLTTSPILFLSHPVPPEVLV